MSRMARKKNVVICDLDGTLADDSHRNHHLHPPHGGRDWDVYFSLCEGDSLKEDVADLIHDLNWRSQASIRLYTGRCESTREATMRWLEKHSIFYDELRMRPRNEREDDHIMKIKWGLEIGVDKVWFVLEDRQRVVDAWRKAGFTCLQVAPGNF